MDNGVSPERFLLWCANSSNAPEQIIEKAFEKRGMMEWEIVNDRSKPAFTSFSLSFLLLGSADLLFVAQHLIAETGAITY